MREVLIQIQNTETGLTHENCNFPIVEDTPFCILLLSRVFMTWCAKLAFISSRRCAMTAGIWTTISTRNLSYICSFQTPLCVVCRSQKQIQFYAFRRIVRLCWWRVLLLWKHLSSELLPEMTVSKHTGDLPVNSNKLGITHDTNHSRYVGYMRWGTR